jgi:hypothetical protein
MAKEGATGDNQGRKGVIREFISTFWIYNATEF